MAAKRSVPRSRQADQSATAGLRREIRSPVQAATLPLLRSGSQTMADTAGYYPEAVTCGN
jgi:hypothetical protein